MRFEIDEAVIKNATRCKKGFACLHCEDHVYCSVEQCLMHKIHFIECLHDEPCAYKNTLENSPICTCPVRKEIFTRYGK
jgi:hypothetical protein